MWLISFLNLHHYTDITKTQFPTYKMPQILCLKIDSLNIDVKMTPENTSDFQKCKNRRKNSMKKYV